MRDFPILLFCITAFAIALWVLTATDNRDLRREAQSLKEKIYFIKHPGCDPKNDEAK